MSVIEGIIDSYRPLAGTSDPAVKTFLADLPDDYLTFLRAHNGGVVDAFRYSFLTGVPFKTQTVNNPSRDDCPVEFFGVPPDKITEGYPDNLLEVAEEHAGEGFLPRGVFAIARCVQNSLVCLSRREEDHGAVYYWDWYWQYPWCEGFFLSRIDAVRAEFDNPDAILADETHPRHAQLRDALNFATLLRVAPNFSTWISQCEDRREHA